MKKLVLFLILVNGSLISKSTIILNDKAKKKFPGGEPLEQTLKKNLNPLIEVLKKTMGNGDIFLEMTCNSKCSLFLYSKKNCLAFQASWTPHTTPLVIDLLTILPEYRGHAIGSTCIQCFDNPQLAALLGYRTISLESMEPVQKFYEKLGFKPHNPVPGALFTQYTKEI